jgi:hypothetical protein
MDLVIDIDPIPIDFWHRRFPRRIPRGLILAIRSALGTGFEESGDRRLKIFDVRHSFNLSRERYQSIHNIP